MHINPADVIDIQALEKIINSFAIAANLNAQFITNDCSVVISPAHKCETCGFCQLVQSCPEGKKRCLASMSKSGELAVPIGEPYIANCHAGMIEIYSPIVYNDIYLGVVACGPLLLWQLDDLARGDILARVSDLGLSSADVMAAAAQVKVLSERDTLAAADILYVMVNHIVKTGMHALLQQKQILKQQMLIADMIIDRKRANECAQGAYPIEKERELLNSMRLGDAQTAAKRLNELLGGIFYQSAGNLDVIRQRARELLVLMSRAVMESGGDTAKLLKLSGEFLARVDGHTRFEDVCFDCAGAVEAYCAARDGPPKFKSVGLLAEALSIIQNEFKYNLTLGEIAERIHINPYYLSHLFKDELGFTFLDYLTNVRMEEARRLLLTTKRPLSQIAEATGYSDAGYFTKVFRKANGVTPNEFRKKG